MAFYITVNLAKKKEKKKKELIFLYKLNDN